MACRIALLLAFALLPLPAFAPNPLPVTFLGLDNEIHAVPQTVFLREYRAWVEKLQSQVIDQGGGFGSDTLTERGGQRILSENLIPKLEAIEALAAELQIRFFDGDKIDAIDNVLETERRQLQTLRDRLDAARKRGGRTELYVEEITAQETRLRKVRRFADELKDFPKLIAETSRALFQRAAADLSTQRPGTYSPKLMAALLQKVKEEPEFARGVQIALAGDPASAKDPAHIRLGSPQAIALFVAARKAHPAELQIEDVKYVGTKPIPLAELPAVETLLKLTGFDTSSEPSKFGGFQFTGIPDAAAAGLASTLPAGVRQAVAESGTPEPRTASPSANPFDCSTLGFARR